MNTTQKKPLSLIYVQVVCDVAVELLLGKFGDRVCVTFMGPLRPLSTCCLMKHTCKVSLDFIQSGFLIMDTSFMFSTLSKIIFSSQNKYHISEILSDLWQSNQRGMFSGLNSGTVKYPHSFIHSFIYPVQNKRDLK